MELADQGKAMSVPVEKAKAVDRFRCRCGVQLNDVHAAQGRDGGMLFWDVEKEQVEERAGALLSKFLEALRSKKKRRDWLQDYYGSNDEPDLSDVEVLFEVLFFEEFRSRHTVLRCPDCGRLYVGPNSSDGTWRCFKPEDGEETE